MKNITKTFGSVIANDKVNLDIYKGEILSLLGENGSGKTTLMNMLSGIYFPDEGQIFINGKEEVIRSPKDALRLGIGMVHQHFKLIDVLSATENIILGLEGRLNIKEASRKIEEICDKYGFFLLMISTIFSGGPSADGSAWFAGPAFCGSVSPAVPEPKGSELPARPTAEDWRSAPAHRK